MAACQHDAAPYMATTKRVYKVRPTSFICSGDPFARASPSLTRLSAIFPISPSNSSRSSSAPYKGESFVPAAETFRITRRRPHGHVEAVLAMIHKLGLEELIAAKPPPQRDLVIAMVAERLLFPSSKLAHTRHSNDTYLGLP